MAQNARVPKFGNWEGGNVQYTAYFENARKGRGLAGAKSFNPNHPEENPNALISKKNNNSSSSNYNNNSSSSNYNNNDNNNSTHGRSRAATAKEMPVTRQQQYQKHHSRENSTGSQGMESPARDSYGRHGESINVQRTVTKYKSTNSESVSDKSSSDYSLQSHQSHSKGKNTGDDRYISSLPPQQPRQRAVNNQRVDNHHRVASVPKFGVWDETNPTSGDGFTVIFNKVKEEKQNAAVQFPKVETEPTGYSHGQKQKTRASSKSKMWCCFVPMGSG